MKRLAGAVAAGSVLLVAGCSGGSAGEAEPMPSSVAESPSTVSGSPSSAASGPGQDLPHSGAPAVSNPLPESVLSGDPCDALTLEQVEAALGEGASDGERQDQNATGPGCSWSNRDTGAGFTVGFSTVTREGLSAQYANTKPQMPVFREIDPIGGFPALQFKKGPDDTICTVAVGLADEYSMTVTGSSSYEAEQDGKDPCVAAERTAETVVENLKKKA
ncbi:DUF3558 domain-containing protein [Prauserella halophila]|uniref:DUF3558 domain-containing protein n=1 Tax=Prauserella halophila TaxID=185641 RepID=A0ABP4GWN6_9PSEU|nr:DUF3558 domain-containing protein [Prauserella halophila]MCP2236903.1 Protein of unknown function (DUF3558) [Prauserella halophila]